MADRSFTIMCSKGITLNILPMKVSDQFTQSELTTTTRIATLCTHVERAIVRIKNYKLLGDNCMARLADQIFNVCEMLSNFSSLCVNDSFL